MRAHLVGEVPHFVHDIACQAVFLFAPTFAHLAV